MKTILLKQIATMSILGFIIIGCGEGNASGGSSTSSTSKAPIILSPKVYSIDENKREAFQIEAIDNSTIKFYLSERDFNLFQIDMLTGEVFFKEPTDYEKKSTYSVKIVVEDSAYNRTEQNITINIKDAKNENFIKPIHNDNPLNKYHEDEYFITAWKTDNIGISRSNQIIIPTKGDGYHYSVDWGDGTSSQHLTTDAIHEYEQKGEYIVKIVGDFPQVYFAQNYDNNNSTIDNDAKKLLSIEQWGNNEWNSMGGAFTGCSNMQGNSIDKPNLSKVETIYYMFSEASQFNQDIGDWDVSNIKNMEGLFFNASNFNKDISSWNVSNVNNMYGMFYMASNFNQNIGAWDVSNVKTMEYMLSKASKFNQNIGAWDVSNVTTMKQMFDSTSSFNQNLENWDVSNVKNMKDMFIKTTALETLPSWYENTN